MGPLEGPDLEAHPLDTRLQWILGSISTPGTWPAYRWLWRRALSQSCSCGKQHSMSFKVIPSYISTAIFNFALDLFFVCFVLFCLKRGESLNMLVSVDQMAKMSRLWLTWWLWCRVRAICILVALCAPLFLSHFAPDRTLFWKQCTDTNS